MPEAIATGLREEKERRTEKLGIFPFSWVNYVPDAFRSSANCESGVWKRAIRTGSDTADIHAEKHYYT